MAFTYDLETDAGQVRLLIPDNDSDNQIFSDAEIAAFLAMPGVVGLTGATYRAAAAAVRTIARSEALRQKVMKTRGVETDGAKLAAELRQQAKELIEMAQDAEAAEDGGIVSQAIARTDFQRRGVESYEDE